MRSARWALKAWRVEYSAGSWRSTKHVALLVDGQDIHDGVGAQLVGRVRGEIIDVSRLAPDEALE